MVKKQKTISKAAVAFVCCLLSIQLFPPLLVLDSSSLRHFLIALFDISALGFVLHYTIKYKANILNLNCSRGTETSACAFGSI